MDVTGGKSWPNVIWSKRENSPEGGMVWNLGLQNGRGRSFS